MLKYLLFPLRDHLSVFNVFQYITFRSAYAAITALLISFLFGPWVIAKLRALKTDQNLLLLVTNMGAGHAGASGRYDYLKEIARDYAFLIDRLVGKTEDG